MLQYSALFKSILLGSNDVAQFEGAQSHTHLDTPVAKCEVVCVCVSAVVTLTVWGHKYSLSIHQSSEINRSTTDKTQNTRLHGWHVKSIIYCKVAGIAHRRLMAFYQGSLEVCSPPPPTAQLPLMQGRFSSRAHFPNCTCFQSKMSDISETNSPRFCSFIFTQSHH